jgi:hypothetical protein
MDDLDMHAALLGHLDRLRQRLQNVIRFIAQMRKVAGVVALEHMAERDHLIGPRIRAGRREQAG